ncbi:MAG: FAD-binding oxidoreductase [Candidatus Kariarchaeaceae archaeon]
MSKTKILEQRFKENFSSNIVDRVIYSSDLAPSSKIISFFFTSKAIGILLPRSIPDLQEMIEFCYQNKISFIPRGTGTSGYGGATPTRKSVIIDCSRLTKIISFDNNDMTAIVEPGVTFEQLSRFLEGEKLVLRSYPSSAPAATIAGWIAQGGMGYGAAKYGTAKDQVASFNLIRPDGTLESYSDDLNLIYSLSGITGVISQLTIKVRTLTKDEIIGYSSPSLEKILEKAVNLTSNNSSIHTVHLQSPSFISLKQLIDEGVRKADREYSSNLNDQEYHLLVVSEEEIIQNDLIEDSQTQLLSLEQVKEEWEKRFTSLRIKRLGPSIMPCEVVIPLDQFAIFIQLVNKKYKEPISWESHFVKGSEVIILFYFFTDERSFSLNFAFLNPLVIVQLAEKVGGRAYALGYWFAGYEKKLLSPATSNKVRHYKKKHDSKRLCNPDKVFSRRFKWFPLMSNKTVIKLGSFSGQIIKKALKIKGHHEADTSYLQKMKE